MTESYACPSCKKRHAFPVYVFAHWNDRITHTCDCGARNGVRAGRLVCNTKPKEAKDGRINP